MSDARLPEPSDAVVRVDSLSKWFGDVVAVSDMSFEIRPGITGLLGPNGAGKTTLLRMIAGLSTQSEGTLSVFGQNPRANLSLYKRIGVMVEHDAGYDFMTGREFVTTAARLRRVSETSATVGRAIELVDLEDAADRRLRTYSRGMKQRIRLAAVLVHEPDLLLLDEPLSGADPRQRLQFQALLVRLAEAGRTIVVSSHILEEVEQLAETVILIVRGKLAAEGDYHAIRAALDDRPYHVRVVADAPRALAAALVGLSEVEAVRIDPDGALVIESSHVARVQTSLAPLAQSLGVRIKRVEPLDDSLESVFEYLVDR